MISDDIWYHIHVCMYVCMYVRMYIWKSTKGPKRKPKQLVSTTSPPPWHESWHSSPDRQEIRGIQKEFCRHNGCLPSALLHRLLTSCTLLALFCNSEAFSLVPGFEISKIIISHPWRSYLQLTRGLDIAASWSNQTVENISADHHFAGNSFGTKYSVVSVWSQALQNSLQYLRYQRKGVWDSWKMLEARELCAKCSMSCTTWKQMELPSATAKAPAGLSDFRTCAVMNMSDWQRSKRDITRSCCHVLFL